MTNWLYVKAHFTDLSDLIWLGLLYLGVGKDNKLCQRPLQGLFVDGINFKHFVYDTSYLTKYFRLLLTHKIN